MSDFVNAGVEVDVDGYCVPSQVGQASCQDQCWCSCPGSLLPYRVPYRWVPSGGVSRPRTEDTPQAYSLRGFPS
ncbi:hypothetical protein PC114_g25896 [Phytophthora cactorum]|uniref:Uncharacterized protein n=1 Tax=Phytophthora cactorum TaxID=29920 RepID=A0A8T1AG01_9STRA|nr:hypothetical protein PC114_g25896 [Phytophthora cactorum]KAG2878663.1 hypothetical protein PC115_g23004 [Phytophthora cactorum]